MKTIKDNPALFKIVTLINVDLFEQMLQNHPNQPFIDSVCQGLCEGFWPWANTHHEFYPPVVDESLGMPQNTEEGNFLQTQ